MMLLIIQIALALCALGAKADTLVGVGVNYGRLGDNLPPPSDVVKLFQNNAITRMRLFDPDIAVLDALKSTNISLTLGIRTRICRPWPPPWNPSTHGSKPTSNHTSTTSSSST
ncbi:hypothetical protein K1719_016632 [Acacia pycnantha]|nr:hypothetical protein K1719_016632 [Acacia pycnantha]